MRWIYLIRVTLTRLNPHGCSWFGAPSSVLLRGTGRSGPEPGEAHWQPAASTSHPSLENRRSYRSPDVLGWALDWDAGAGGHGFNWQTPAAEQRESHSRSVVLNPPLRFSNTGKYFMRVLYIACARLGLACLACLPLPCCCAVHRPSVFIGLHYDSPKHTHQVTGRQISHWVQPLLRDWLMLV